MMIEGHSSTNSNNSNNPNNFLLSRARKSIDESIAKIKENRSRSIFRVFFKSKSNLNLNISVIDSNSSNENGIEIVTKRVLNTNKVNIRFILDINKLLSDHINTIGARDSGDSLIVECMRMFLYAFYGYDNEKYKDHNKRVVKASAELVVNDMLELKGPEYFTCDKLGLPNKLSIDEYYIILMAMLNEEKNEQMESQNLDYQDKNSDQSENEEVGSDGSNINEDQKEEEVSSGTDHNDKQEKGVLEDNNLEYNVDEESVSNQSDKDDSVQGQNNFSKNMNLSDMLDNLCNDYSVSVSGDMFDDLLNSNIKSGTVSNNLKTNCNFNNKQKYIKLDGDLKAILDEISSIERSKANVFYDYEKSWMRLNNRRSRRSNLLTPGRIKTKGMYNTEFDRSSIIFLDKSLSTRDISDKMNYLAHLVHYNFNATIITYSSSMSKIYLPGMDIPILDKASGNTNLLVAVKEYEENFGSLDRNSIYVITDGYDEFNYVLENFDTKIWVLNERNGRLKAKITSDNYKLGEYTDKNRNMYYKRQEEKYNKR